MTSTELVDKCRDHESGEQKWSNLDELSAGIAHEINNPLGIIAQEVEWVLHLLKSDGLKNVKEIEEFRDSVEEISRQVERCRYIVERILGLARQCSPVLQPVDLNEIILNMIRLMEKEAKSGARQVTFITDLRPDMPKILTDAPLLRQVVLNLLINARQAVDAQGQIRVTTDLRDDYFVTTVEDNGSGIPKENLQRIFAPFFSTKPPGQGTGLGLAICRGVVERLGGQISVASEPDKCTAFTILLPVNPQEYAEAHDAF